MSIQSYQIANRECVKKRVDDLKHHSEETKGRLANSLKHLWDPERVFRQVLINEEFYRLRNSFPQFTEAVNYFENTIISLSELIKKARLTAPFFD